MESPELVNRIYVGNLPSLIGEDELKKEFERFGEITNVNIKLNYAFIVCRVF